MNGMCGDKAGRVFSRYWVHQVAVKIPHSASTSFCFIISGLFNRSNGEVLFDGKRRQRIETGKKRNMHSFPVSRSVYDTMTVLLIIWHSALRKNITVGQNTR